MANSLYIAGIEPGSGKSLVALGVMELLSRRVRQIGYFRPVIPSKEIRDNNIQLIDERYHLESTYDEMYAFAHDDAQAMVSKGSTEVLLKEVLNKYKALEGKCQFVLCEGTDFSGLSSAFEFDFNADVAANLGCPILVLVNGRRKTTDDIVGAVDLAHEAFGSKGCSIVATIVNRVVPGQRETVASRFTGRTGENGPVYFLPEIDLLGKPTVKEIAAALQAQIIQGTPEGLYRTVHDLKVAAMNFPHFLNHVADGDLVITPGDRSEVILASMAAALSDATPSIAGLLLTGDQPPAPQVLGMVEGFRASSPIPIIRVETDTFTTAMQTSAVPPVLSPGDDRKIAAALGGFEAHIDLKQLEERIDVVHSVRVTPIMFE